MIRGQRKIRGIRDRIKPGEIVARLPGVAGARGHMQGLSGAQAKALLRYLDLEIVNTSVVTGPTVSDALASLNTAIGAIPGTAGGWKDVVFGASGTYFTQTMFPSTTTYTLAAGQRLEILSEVYTSGVNASQVMVSSDATKGYKFTVQADNNSVVYWNNAGVDTVLAARGVNTNNNWKGLHRYDTSFSVAAASDNRLTARIEQWRLNGDNDYKDTNVNLVGTAVIYLLTDDITKCSVQARVLG